MVWFNNSRARLDALNLKHLTQVEKEIRQQMLITVDFFRRHVPGFEHSFLVDTAPQVGVRSSRRLQGQYTLTRDDMLQGTVFPDVVTTCASGIDGRPLINIPYRCFLPPKINRLLVAGRCISTDFVTQTIVRIIPSCMAMGQAMGTAAALAVREGIPPAQVDVPHLQSVLAEDGLYLNRPSQ
jgi:hypothetical protein